MQRWQGGLFRGGFDTAADLQSGIIRALHDFTVANVVGAVDQDELGRRAAAMIPSENRNQATSAALDVAVTGGPTQRILRPVEIESADLSDALLQAALFGSDQIFDRALGSEPALVDGALALRQDRGASLRLDEKGSLLLHLPLDDAGRRRGGADLARSMGDGMVLFENAVQQRLASALRPRAQPRGRATSHSPEPGG